MSVKRKVTVPVERSPLASAPTVTRPSVLGVVPAPAEPVEELADADHREEDESHDEHREDDVLALLGRVREIERAAHPRATLPDENCVGGQGELDVRGFGREEPWATVVDEVSLVDRLHPERELGRRELRKDRLRRASVERDEDVSPEGAFRGGLGSDPLPHAASLTGATGGAGR